MNIISFFSGAGGLDLGFEKAGFNIKMAVEIDSVMCETLNLNKQKNNNTKIIQRDILQTTTTEILAEANLKAGEVTGIIGGSPCQSFSTAGNRSAFSDVRGQAMIKYIDLINEIRPQFFVLENVKGLLSTPLEHLSTKEKKELEAKGIPLKDSQKKGSAFEFILNRIRGYDIQYKLLNSADYGVPQKRERVFLIGFLKDSDKDYNYKYPLPTHAKDGLQEDEVNLFNFEDDKHFLKKWVSFQDVTSHLKEEHMHFQNYSPKRLEFMKLIPQGGGNWKDLKVYGEDLVKKAMQGAYSSGGGKVGFYRRIKAHEPTPTLLTSPSQNSTNLGHPYKDRPLSIEEYLIIQQFPPNYKLAGKLSEQYKQIGNAVPVGLAYAVAQSIKKTLKKEQCLV